MNDKIRNWTRKFAAGEINRITANLRVKIYCFLPPKWTEKIAKREMLKRPSVQKRQEMGRLSECGHMTFDSPPSPASSSF